MGKKFDISFVKLRSIHDTICCYDAKASLVLLVSHFNIEYKQDEPQNHISILKAFRLCELVYKNLLTYNEFNLFASSSGWFSVCIGFGELIIDFDNSNHIK